jgi:hypothetical protein
MSSPPTSSTSTKNALLHQHQRRFDLRTSSLGGLNPFQRKPTQAAQEVEPYEIAPGTGILNTDATAKVFGYLDREEQEKREAEKRRKKAKRKKPACQNRSRSRSPVKKLAEKYKEVHADDGTDDFRHRTHRQHVEAQVRAVQEKRDDARRIWEENLERGKRGRMVSEEDRLRSRGANPRTGIVTPYVATERNSSDSGYGTDYLRVEPQHGPTLNQGTWKQTEQGWSIVEDTEPYDVQSQQHRGAAVEADNRLAREDNSKHPATDNEQELRYFRSLRKAYRQAGDGRVFHDPNAPPSPRIQSPVGPSSPPPKLIRIPRKKVGSGAKNREDSDDTVIINERLRSTTMPTHPDYQQLRQRVRVIPPHNDLRSSKPSHTHVQNPMSFLERLLGTKSDPCLSHLPAHVSGGPVGAQAVPNGNVRSDRSTYQYPEKARSLDHFRSATVAHQVPSAVSNPMTHFPALRFPHPSQMSNLPSSYRRPPSLEPQNVNHNTPRPGATDARTITTTTTTTPQPQSRRKPPLVRRQGLETYPNPVSKGNFQSAQPSHSISENLHQKYQNINPQEPSTSRYTTTNGQINDDTNQSGMYEAQHTPMQNHPTPFQKNIELLRQTTRLPGHPSNASASLEQYQAALPPATNVPKSQDQYPTNPPPITNAQIRSSSNLYTGWVTTDAQLEPLVSNTSSPRTPCENTTHGQIPTRSLREGLRVTSGNIDTAERGRERTRNGDGWIPTGVRDESTNDTSMGECQVQPLRIRKKRARFAERSSQSPMVDVFEDTGSGAGCGIHRNDSLRKRIAAIRTLVPGVDLRLELTPYAVGKQVVRLLVIMLHHVVVTFHPSSMTMHVLRDENAGREQYWAAVAEVLKAVVYLLVFVHLGLVGWRVGLVMWRVGGLVVRPVRGVLVVMKWVVVG